MSAVIGPIKLYNWEFSNTAFQPYEMDPYSNDIKYLTSSPYIPTLMLPLKTLSLSGSEVVCS